MNDPDVFGNIHDDNLKADHFDAENLLQCPATVAIVCSIKNEPFGCFIYLPYTANILDVHSACKKEFRGRHFLKAAFLSLDYVFKHTNALSVVTMCPSFNKASRFFAAMCGFEKVGEIKKSYLKNGHKYDLIMYQKQKKTNNADAIF